MPSIRDVKCKGPGCSTIVARENHTGLCHACYVRSRQPAVRHCARCRKSVHRTSKTGLCKSCFDQARHDAKPSERVRADQKRKEIAGQLSEMRAKYDQALLTIEQREREIKALGVLGQGLETVKIAPRAGEGTSEGLAILVASDWHVEERVKPGTVSGLNEYTLDIAKTRATNFFRAGLRLVRLLQQDIKIDTLALPLLGDFITNDIHDELADVAELQPMHAITFAQNLLASGIEFLLEHSKLALVLNCHWGNHARTTKTTRFAVENGHSLEYLMYLSLAAYFRAEPRVQFIIPEGPHSYLDVYGQTVRFHHGHMIKYQGGIGGIFIPAFKAVAQWNKARAADLDVFGHFHQCKDGGNFVCNGSLIGYNAFALSIKADYEPPRQQLLLLDKKRGRTCTWPVLV